MPIIVRLATDADVPAMARIGSAAFDPATDPLTSVIFPPHLRRPGEDYDPQLPWRIARKTSKLANPGTIMMVAVETKEDDGGDDQEVVVGSAWWSLPGTASAADAGALADVYPGVPFPPEMDVEAFARIKDEVLAAERSVFGAGGSRACYELESLSVDPKHHRRGIGNKLVQWGLERAAGENKDVFLIASAAGNGLYKKCGFKEVGMATLAGAPMPIMVVKNAEGPLGGSEEPATSA